MSNLSFLCKYVVQVPWRLLHITVTIITIPNALFARMEHTIVLINGVSFVGKLHLWFEPTASVDRWKMASFRGGSHSVEMEVDVDELWESKWLWEGVLRGTCMGLTSRANPSIRCHSPCSQVQLKLWNVSTRRIVQNTTRLLSRLKSRKRKVYQSLVILLLRYAVQLNIDKYLLVFYIAGFFGGHIAHRIVISSLEGKYWQVQS